MNLSMASMNDNKPKYILTVTDNPVILSTLRTVSGIAGYMLSTASNIDAALRYLDVNVVPDLILLDSEMPNLSGYDLVKKIKSNASTSHIPVIFLSANDDNDELEGLTIGAINYISKSTPPLLLHKKIDLHLLVEAQKHKIVSQEQELLLVKQQLIDFGSDMQRMVDERTKAATELKNTVLKTAAMLVEYRDDATGGHIERIESYISILLEAMLEQNIYAEQLHAYDIDIIIQTSVFHDVGKVAVRESILLKPGKLSYEEFEEMKKHTTIGKTIIENAQKSASNQKFFEYAKTFAVSHHEQWNGNGYPYSLSGKAIPLLGRIMAIADVYDALVSERPYKVALSHEKAVEIIMADKGKQFDPLIADVFYKVSDRFENVN